MRYKIKRTFGVILIGIFSLLLLAIPVLAAYSADITVSETSGNPYDMYPALHPLNVTHLVDESFITATGRDANVMEGATALPRMLANNKLLFADDLGANSSATYQFTTGSALTNFDIITGYGGYITVADDATLELGSDFEIEQKGWVDTDATTPVSFQEAGVVSDAANGNVTPALPVGWSPNDIWLCLITSLDNVNSTLPAGWTAIDTGTNNGANLRTTLYWRRAVAGDVAPLVTHAEGAGISVVIVGYSGVTLDGSPFDVNQGVYVKTPASVVNNFGAGITTTVHNDTIVLLSGVGGQTTSITYTGIPTPTERVDAPNTAARPSLIIADFPLVTAGATGARTSTIISFLNNGYQLSLIPIQKNLVYKEDAYRTYIDGATNITSEIPGDDSQFSTLSDGQCVNVDAVYATCRTAAVSTNVDSAGVTIQIGQRLVGFTIARGYVYFDTSGIPGGVTITSAILSLYGNDDLSVVDFDVVIQDGQPTHPEDPLVVGDYSMAFYSGDGGSFNTSTFNPAAYNDITLNVEGLTYINIGGTTKLCLRSREDIDNSQPGGDEYILVQSSNTAGTNQDPLLVIEYFTSVTAPGIASGEYTVKTSLSGGTFSIQIDSEAPITTAFAGSVLDDDVYDWELNQNNVMPYMEYYKHTVGGTLIAHYEPVDIISGTALPDRAVASDEPGKITWGANPTGVSITMGSFEGEAAEVAAAGEAVIPDVVGEVGEPPDMFPAEEEMTGSDLPWYPFIRDVAALTDTDVQMFMWFGSAVFVFFAMAITFRYIQNLMLTGVMGAFATGICAAMSLIPAWVLIPVVLVAIALAVTERSQSI